MSDYGNPDAVLMSCKGWPACTNEITYRRFITEDGWCEECSNNTATEDDDE